MQPTKILIIEDDVVLNKQLSDLLRDQGYLLERCFDGEDGLNLAIAQNVDLILLDVMLPRRDGFSLLRILRKSCQVPVIILTAKGAEEERIRGFSHGVDDYLTKPFNSTELLLRIEAILRRSRGDIKATNEIEMTLDGLCLKKLDQATFADDHLVELTSIQFRLLWTLMQHKGDVLSKAFLYQTVLNKTFGSHDRSLDMHLSRVRRKLISSGWQGERLQTVHGKGYCLS